MKTETLKAAIELAKMLEGGSSKPSSEQSSNRPVIVRSRDAGVQYGYLDRFEGSTVYLSKARQMWSWTAAQGGTLIDCANHGVKGGKFSTMGGPVVVIGACAIIDVAPEAMKSLEDAKWA